MSVTDWEIQQAMLRYGGSFAKAIAEAWSRADPENEARLKSAFPELFDEYRELARLHKERANA